MELTSGIVCVLDDNNTPAGAGFVVSDGLIVTCAHVLGEPRPKQVVIVFQATNERREARVIDQCWRSENAEDVALLQVIGSLPLGVQPFFLGTATGTRGHTIHTFGFPVAGEVDGVLGTGTVLGLGAQTKAGQPLLQVHSSEITSGFSGAPLWDESRQRVIGMVVIVAKPDASGKLGETAFATPTETLRMVCPMLRVSDLCPYRNLDAFTEADAAFFFGRERVLDELLESLRNESRFLAVFGPSGSGKSSVVQAGLVPLLRRGAIPGSSHWEIKFIRPVDNPFKALMVLHLVDESNDLIAGTRAWLSQNPKQSRLVLIIDQFEELFVSCSEALREEFVAQLTKLLEGSAPLSVILTMRDDFYSYFIQYETLAKRLRRGLVNITPTLKREEITAIVEKPAQAVGFRFADGLVAAIVKEVLETASGVQGLEGRSTILPLLEFALTLLWEECEEEGVLTYEAYSKIGGVTGSLTQWADKVFFDIEDEDKRLLSRHIFTNLVYLGDETQGRPDTRQRKPLDSLPRNEGEREKVLQLVQYFVQNRLLVAGRDIQTNEESVELIHEALIKEWGQLKWWLAEDHRFLVWQQKLKERIREWIETDVENPDKRDEYKLLGGRELTEAIEWENGRSTDLSQLERDFIQCSKERQEQAAGHLQRLYDMALARQLAAQAELMRSQQANLLEQSVLLAVEAMRRFPSVEADVALRRGLALLPRSIATMELTDSAGVITFSSDGKYIATGSTDGIAWVWEAETGRQVLRITHPGDVRAVSFSPDGTYLATASGDEAARLWEMTTGREVARLPQVRVFVLVFSPDGKYIATATGSSWVYTYPPPEDHTARVWEVPTGRELTRITHAGNVAALAFSPDGKYLATGSDNGEAVVWDYATSREIARSPHKDIVRALTFSPNGRYLATATGLAEAARENTTLIWEAATGREVARMDQIGLVRAIAFSPEGKYLATGSADGTARLWRAETTRWETETGRELTCMAHADTVTSLAFSPDGAYLATASWDHTAHVWSTIIGWEIAYLPHKHDLDAIAFSPDGTYLATTNVYETLVWEIATSREVVHIDIYYAGDVVAFSPDGRYLAIGGSSGRVSVLEASNDWRAVFVREPSYKRVTAIAFSPDGKYLAAGQDGGIARIWEIATWQEVTPINHTDDVDALALAFSPDSRYLATAGRKRSDPWEAAIIGRNVSHTVRKPEDYFAVVWEVATDHEVTRIIGTGDVISLAFSPDGKHLATAGGNRTAQVWEITTGQEVLHLAHEQQVLEVSYSPNGKYFATGSADGIARLWEAATGRELARIAHEKGVRALTFSPNGRYVATASQADAWVWLWRTEDLIAEACSRLTRNLTREEWRAYLGDEPYRKTCPNLP